MTAARRRQNPRRRPVHRRITPTVRLGIYDDWINILSCCLIDLNAFIANYMLRRK
ncbi:hypothetical protein HanHA300_Chr06g0209561 [Helianthus annuus]|nr:hypothetical protein HanHA300_Chr06g0209561 [Helianthus annuus]KAJ0573281.1 hypothetical protein HanHA89_Chr06g0225011 [Helianthus annuus]KAJ0915142.1 hypothetical protein HanPSC8_Chr06g0246561 [Helianthus annuus]